jgi:probable phosphoglycerate mutase
LRELCLTRHGETEWSRSGQHTGRTDLPLTVQGERQAALLGRRLAGRKFALVLTRPRRRARETASVSVLGHEREARVIRNWDESYDLLEEP